MENSINNRIRLVYKSLNITLKYFSEKASISEGSLKNMFSRGTKPSFDILEKIANAYPNISLEWLLTGKGSMYKEEKESSNNISVNAGDNNSGILSHIGSNSNLSVSTENKDLSKDKVLKLNQKQALQLALLEKRVKELEGRLLEKEEIIKTKDKLIESLEDIIKLMKNNR